MSELWLLLAMGMAGPPQLRIVVDLPAYRVEALVGDSIAFTAPVAIGRAGYRTPRGEFSVASVEWNPWWFPPDRPWARHERAMPPGPSNWMGRVKINFEPLYYLHGTPFTASLGTAASHGCVRMRNEDAVALATLVLRFGAPDLTLDQISALASSADTRSISLTQPVPVQVRYELVEVRRGVITVYRDVYALSHEPLRQRVMRALAENGMDTTRADTARIRALTARVGPRGRAAALTDLVPEARRLTPPAAR